ncbi:hypothetical protein KC19_8G177600 [Ceratodon purpureus]|uniref:very-long-chain (3R)-3-hydroxyacyl-CoA dehydratase n=1 Tax=Ceratodon purpureus TaxID=3225 RepID=A0A8T0H4C6_CERPU|nr:hypothetical protein KC19_8G177600 [Ceratodon purpureus]
MQWLGRSHVLFAIIAKLPEVQDQPPVMITFLAWSMSEVRCLTGTASCCVVLLFTVYFFLCMYSMLLMTFMIILQSKCNLQ